MKSSRIKININIDNLLFNLNNIKNYINKNTKIILIIKDLAYGHDLMDIAKLLEDIDYIYGYGVANTNEGILLRKNNVKKPILNLGCVFDNEIESSIFYDLTNNIYNYDICKKISNIAVKQNKIVNIHISVDTGMGRLGFLCNEKSYKEIEKISSLSNIKITGMFSHFSSADDISKDLTCLQFKKFNKFINDLKSYKVDLSSCKYHISNSAGIINYKQYNLDMVRVGILMYGIYPSFNMDKSKINLKPVLSLKSHIINLKYVDKGYTISYSGTYITDKITKIATIPIGYGDGYPINLSNKFYVLINGKRANIIGKICMDQFMVDVTDINDVHIFDEVVLIGKSGNEEILLEDLCKNCEKIPYEVLCNLNKRVRRNYYKNDKLYN